LRRRIGEIDKKIDRLADLVSEMRTPDALLRHIETLENERARLQGVLESMEEERATSRSCAISPRPTCATCYAAW
jgi:hypothetical protein